MIDLVEPACADQVDDQMGSRIALAITLDEEVLALVGHGFASQIPLGEGQDFRVAAGGFDMSFCFAPIQRGMIQGHWNASQPEIGCR